MRRGIQIAASILVAVVLAAATAAWFALDPGPLHRIVVSSNNAGGPVSERPSWAIAIEENGSYSYSTDTFKRRGRIAFAPYAQRFRAIPEIRWDPPPTGGWRPGMYFWAVGTRRTAAPYVSRDGTDHQPLRAFAAALHDAVIADMRRIDAPRIGALNGLDRLRSVEMRARGAMCGGCLWTLRIEASGHAHAHTDQPFNEPRALEHDASLPWSDVVGAFRRAQLGELDATYSADGSDYAGVSFEFVFPRRSFTIDAPDYKQWPPALRRAFVDVLGQIEQAHWSPPIDPRSLPKSASMRRWAAASP